MSFLRGFVLSFLFSFDDFLIYFFKISVARKLFCTFAVRNKFVVAPGSEKLRLSIPTSCKGFISLVGMKPLLVN